MTSSPSSQTRGAFIVLEGLDRAGKSTQVALLCSTLSSLSRNIQSIRFPDRTSPIGQMIDGYLRSGIEMEDHAIHLLFSANRWEKAKWISHQLSLGTTIICDRYYYSGMVYSAAKKNPSLPLSWTKHPEVGLPRPDAVIFLDLDPEEAAKRGGYGDEKYETQTMQKNVRELFMQLKEEGAEMVVVDAGKSVEKVHERIMQELGDVLGAVARGEMGREVRRVGPW